MINVTPLFRQFAKYRTAQINALDIASTQEKQLFGLLRFARNTQFAKDHRFDLIRSVKDFQAHVPLRTYEHFWEQYWKDSFPRVENKSWPGLITGYSWTSGTTTGKRKFVPYSPELARSYNKAGIDLLVHHTMNRPQSKVFGGRSFMLGGCTKLAEESPGVYVSEISGFSAQKLPSWIKPFFFPPKELSDITDWVQRTEKIAQACIGNDIRTLGGMPSWLLIFLDKFKSTFGAEEEGLITRIFPNLELFVHGGVNFDPYLSHYKKLTAGGHAEFREIYPASEAFMAVADRGYKEGLRLVLDHDIFYEFVPVEELDKPNPTRHWIANIEKDVNYAIVLTNPAGVWSYILGDTVRFIDTKVPRLLITGRTSYALSAFGEHLINEEIEKAVSAGSEKIDRSITDFTVAPTVSTKPGELGYHVYFVEFSGGAVNDGLIRQFRDTLDQTLLNLNDDYADHRSPGCGVLKPSVVVLKPGTFASWMESRGKLGDQHKVARTLNTELAQSLRSFIESNQSTLCVANAE